jgi:integrase
MTKENKFKFTDERLRKIAPAAAGKREYCYDTATPGLRLTVTDKGSKSFQVQAWNPEKQRSIAVTIGKWPAMALQVARSNASAMQADIHAGADPVLEKQQKRDTLIMADLFELYMREHSKPHKRSWKDDENEIRLHLGPVFGIRRIDEVTTESVRTWHAGLTKTMTQSSANRHLALLRSVYNTMAPDLPNPCRMVKMFKEYSRDRFLQPEELEKFFKAVEDDRTEYSPDIADYVLLSLFTGARRSNILSMQWKDIDFNREQWRIAGEESKNKSIMLIPLITEVLEILTRRRELASSVFVFPGPGKTGHLQEPWKGWQRILKRAGLEDVRLHDLRRTMGSYQTISGASTAIVGKTLGHKNPASTAVYARMTLDPVRDAMKKAVALMHQAAAIPIEEKVVNFKKG